MKQNIRICIDSCVFILGLQEATSDAGRLLDLVSPNLNLLIPRIIAKEVERNLLTSEQKKQFHHLFYNRDFAIISDRKIPYSLLDQYVKQGLREKGDAFIGAFAELEKVDYLISLNRHFLKELRVSAFEIIDPAEFIRCLQYESKIL